MTRRPDLDVDAIRAWTLRQAITNATYRDEQAAPEVRAARRRKRKSAYDHKRHAAKKAAHETKEEA